METRDLDIAAPPQRGPGDTARTPRRPRARRHVFIGIGYLAGAIAAVAISPEFVVPVRVALVAAGFVAGYQALATLGKAVFGDSFDAPLWMSAGWLFVIILGCMLAPVLPLAEHADTAKTLTAASFSPPALGSEHPLGTNNFGLDLLSRTLYGGRVSLIVSLLAVVIALVVGGGLGMLAGYYRGKVDKIVIIGTNVLLAFPPLILLLALASVLQPSTRNISIALSLLATPTIIRLARANTMAFGQREFVLAARAMGARTRRILLRELMPNVVIPVLSYAMVIIAVLIVAEASLSFLGLGIEPPEPTWGNMIAEGRDGVMEQHPHVVLVPGAALFLTVLAFNLIGEKARARWDPRQTQL